MTKKNGDISGLPIGLSEKEFFEGRSLPRNKELMRIFSDMDLCEQLGSGMKKILRAYPQEIFHISEHFIDAVFTYSKEALNVSQRTIERALKSLKEKSVLERTGSDKTGEWKVIK